MKNKAVSVYKGASLRHKIVIGLILVISLTALIGKIMLNDSRISYANSIVPATGKQQLIVKIKSDKLEGKNSADQTEFTKKTLAKNIKVISVKKQYEKQPKNSRKVSVPSDVFAVEVAPGELPKAFQAFKSNGDVASVQYNYVFKQDVNPTDPRYSEQWPHSKTQAPAAWDISKGNNNVSIAVIGTGVKWDHEDLAGNIWSNPSEIDQNGVDDDSNGYVDDVRGWNFDLMNNNPSDRETHETSVAGVAAAVTNNGLGVAGACWECKVMPLRIKYESSQVADAIYYAANNGAKVINMSFGSYDPYKYGLDTVVEQAINEVIAKGVLVVATAGNDSTTDKRFPGAHENVIGVAATDSNDNRAGFSNYGDWVDVAAPGASILSTTPSGYAFVSGTSFAAPYVAGIAAMLYSKDSTLTVAQIRKLIEYNVDKLNTDKPIPSGRLRSDRTVLGQQPSVFSIIKSPYNNALLTGGTAQSIWGTAIGSSYTLDYQVEGSTTWTNISSGTETINGQLGQFTPPASAGYYVLRLTTTNGSLTDVNTVQVATGGNYMSGWPRNLGIGVFVGAPKIADLDGNGTNEMIAASTAGKVAVFDTNGTILTGWPKVIATPQILSTPGIGDINGDGKSEIIVTAYGGGTIGGEIMAFSADGTAVPGWPKKVGQVRGSPALANLDGDPALEIVVANAGGNGQVHVLNGDGSYMPGWPISLADNNVQTSPAIGDLDNNGSLEIVISSWSKLHVISTNGAIQYTWNHLSSHTSPVLADLDNNKDLEIVTHASQATTAYEHTGTVKWNAYTAFGGGYDEVSVANVVGDINPEVIFAATNGIDTQVFLLSNLGKIFTGWPKTANGEPGGQAVVGDVDGDGVLDILVATKASRVYGWQANSGTSLLNFPRPLSSPAYDSPIIADLNKDNLVDITVASDNGTMTVWNMAQAFVAGLNPWPSPHQNASNQARAVPTFDNILPSVKVTSPLTGAVIARNSKVPINVEASDNLAISKIEIYVNSKLLCTDTIAPYSCTWAVPNTRNATYSLQAKAYDTSGNVKDSIISVTAM